MEWTYEQLDWLKRGAENYMLLIRIRKDLSKIGENLEDGCEETDRIDELLQELQKSESDELEHQISDISKKLQNYKKINRTET
jgi:hypothetical protein